MKTKIILLLFLMTAINSLPAVAQAKVEQFSQPYPAGEPLVNNPEFHRAGLFASVDEC